MPKGKINRTHKKGKKSKGRNKYARSGPPELIDDIIPHNETPPKEEALEEPPKKETSPPHDTISPEKDDAATYIQSRLRGNISRRLNDRYIDAQLGVPYRDSSWKDIDIEIPWEVEKKILKMIIHPEGTDIISKKIGELEKEYERKIKVIEYLKESGDKKKLLLLQKEQIETSKEIQQLEKQLKEIQQIDLFKCNAIKKLIKADPRLSLDLEIKELITPCRTLDINIYVNTLYSLPPELFRPEQSHSIYSKIESFPDEIFTNYGKSMLRKTLEDLMLMYEGIRHDNIDYREQDEYYMRSHPDIDPRNIITGPAINRRMSVHRMTRFELLANYYRYSDFNRGVDLEHLESDYYTHPNGRRQFPHLRKGRADGRSSLEQTLELFETNIRSREMVESFPMDDPRPGEEDEGGEGDGAHTASTLRRWSHLPPGPSRLSRKIRKQIPFPEEYVVGPLVREDYLDLQIKRMKIHFILALIGMDDKYKYYQFVRNNIAELKKRLPFSIEDMKLWEKYNKLENLNLEEYDKYFQITDLIKKYKYILDNLL